MSTPDQPESGQLTRRQMREIRSTGATPIVGAGSAVATEEPAAPKPPSAPLARPAVPVSVAPAPGPDAAVDLGVSPLTRRQARQQERIRTASVPVITPEVAAAHLAAPPLPPPPAIAPEEVVWTPDVIEADAPAEEAEVVEAEADAAASADEDIVDAEIVGDGPAENADTPASDSETPVDDHAESDVATETATDAEPEAIIDSVPEAVTEEAPADAVAAEDAPDVAVAAEDASAAEVEAAEQAAPQVETPDEPAADEVWLDPSDAGAEPETAAPTINERFGANLLAVSEPAEITTPSFDELLTRDSGGRGAVATPHALILSHVPEASPLSAVTSTGEVIVTGIYNLPEGLGSQGHARGAADGKEVDATLIDGELPASSSPTPIAASSAISTVRGTGEVIRPPAPEKTNKLMLTLMITAGALALALVGLLVYVVATGVLA